MRRFVSSVAFVSAIVSAGADAQLSGALGPVAQGSSAGAAPWRASALLAGTLRVDQPHSLLTLDASIGRRESAAGSGAFSLSQSYYSASRGGFRLVSSATVAREAMPGSSSVRALGSSSMSYRRGMSGGWLGFAAEREATTSLVSGYWRQLGSRAVVTIASTMRRGSFGGRPARFWTETHFDSVFTDSTGWQYYPVERLFGDSGRAPSRLTWAETEARVGWTIGRVALDGVAGWRPRIDTARHATWMRGYATAAVARNVAVSLGVGTTTRQLPYARSTGRFAMAAVRFAPAALVRPKDTPEVTPAAAAFSVTRSGDGEYLVRVRLPRARVVELSGDFNGWKPIRLARRGRGDVWETTLALMPGTYRVNMRVDGELWIAPPGTATVDDEFNGRVGILVIR